MPAEGCRLDECVDGSVEDFFEVVGSKKVSMYYDDSFAETAAKRHRAGHHLLHEALGDSALGEGVDEKHAHSQLDIAQLERVDVGAPVSKQYGISR